MNRKLTIISGAQTGVDRAALDAAISLGIAYGGSVPKGRQSEAGPVPAKYDKLTELKTGSYKTRTEKNVFAADATLIITEGKPSGGTALTITYASEHTKPCLVIDVANNHIGENIDEVVRWMTELQPNVLNVSGALESKHPGIYMKTHDMLQMILVRYLKDAG